MTLPHLPGRPLLPPPRVGLQRRRQWGHDRTFRRVPNLIALTTVSVAWERDVGGLPRRHVMHGPCLRPAKMAMPLSWEWISMTEYID